MSGSIADLGKAGVGFDYRTVNLRDITVQPGKGYAKERSAGAKKNVLSTTVELGGELYGTTERFWTSLAAKVGVSTNIFNLYDYPEVFDRIVQRGVFSGTGNARVVIDEKNNKLLAVTTPDKKILSFQMATEVIARNEGDSVNYHNGVVTSMHSMPVDTPMQIGGEEYQPRLCVETPIDGWGDPRVYLSLLRQVCSNGMVAYAKAFKTTCKLGGGDDPRYLMNRMFDSYSNDEGLDAISRRLAEAQITPMSIDEAHKLMGIVGKWTDKLDRLKSKVIYTGMRSLFGNIEKLFSIASIDEMNSRQRSMLPTDATVAQAINFLTELTTHHTAITGDNDGYFRKCIQAEIGTLLSKPSGYDLEGTLAMEEIAALEEKTKGNPVFYVPKLPGIQVGLG